MSTGDLALTAVGAVAVVGVLSALVRRRAVREREEGDREWASWVAFRRAMMRDLHERVSVTEGAAMVGRAPSTIHGWMAAGKLARVDGGGRGTPAEVRVIDLLRAEHGVRGKGRPPTVARPA